MVYLPYPTVDEMAMFLIEMAMKLMVMKPMVLKPMKMVMKTLDQQQKILVIMVQKKDPLQNLPNVSFSYPYVYNELDTFVVLALLLVALVVAAVLLFDPREWKTV